MNDTTPKIAYLTSGAAGMFCGSCMHDNTLAAALSRMGVDIQLIPTYTPIRTDENDVSVDQVFFGGINVYLQQKTPLFRYVPKLLDRVFDWPWLIRKATSRASSMSYKELGALTVSMLKGRHGYQRKEVKRLCKWLASSVKPDIVNLSNILIGGCVPAIKEALKVPVLATLQGDDIFLDELPEPYSSQCFEQIRRLVNDVDGFIVNSQFYADYMADYFSIPAEKINVVPLGIDTRDFRQFVEAKKEARDVTTIGYLARLAPEKGLQVLVDAFVKLKQMPNTDQIRLKIAGWLGEHNRPFVDGEFAKLREAGLEDAFEYVGSIDRQQKLDFLKQIDVLSVPTTYREPKGLFVLEALAAGIPVVQPDHGAFPEVLAATGGGVLTPPEDTQALAETLHNLVSDQGRLEELGQAGLAAVHERFNADEMGQRTLAVYEKYLNR